MVQPRPIVSTGNVGFDSVLKGGLPSNRLYLLEGTPGSGKTTLGLQFLMDGVAAGEQVLYITLSETSEELDSVAHSHGWSLEGIDLFEFSSTEEVLGEDYEQSILHPWEAELETPSSLSSSALISSNPSVWFSIAFRKCVFWLKTLCVIAGRC